MNSTWMEDASYLRIRNITLGYSLPPNVAKRLFLQNLLGVAASTVQNAFMFTRYTGYNPEVSFWQPVRTESGRDYARIRWPARR